MNQEFLSGKKLYGDDFNLNEIKKWFKDEEEAYSKLKEDYNIYGYSAINEIHGYHKLKLSKTFKNVLSFGGATGDELLPILNKIENITIIEPSKKLRIKDLKGKKIKYITPVASGKLKLKSNSFNLITCFGTLHHIPNVSFVFAELVRVLDKGGYFLLREPIVSMGDWTISRRGLTKRERGIPEAVFEKLVKQNNLQIISKKKIMFPILRRLDYKNKKAGNNKFFVYLDYLISKLFYWNNKYHSTKPTHKLRPQSIFYVLKKL